MPSLVEFPSEAVRKLHSGEPLSDADLNDPYLTALVQATLPEEEPAKPAYRPRGAGPFRYVPSAEPQPPSHAARLAALSAELRGMLPAGQEWLLGLIQSVLGARSGLGQPSNSELESAPPRKKSPGMLPLPAAPRG